MSAARQPRQPAEAISTILLGLRRAPRQIRKGSREVIETAVSQLFDAAVQPHGVEAVAGEDGRLVQPPVSRRVDSYQLSQLRPVFGAQPIRRA